MEGIDPRHVFKVKATARVADGTWEPRGLSFLGETEGWNYFVITESEDTEKLIQALSLYTSTQVAEGASAPLSSVFGVIDKIEPYGPDDRRGRGLPEDLDALDDEMIVDIQLWPSRDADEARERVSEVHELLEATSGAVIEEDQRPQLTIVRARVGGEALLSILELPVVETVRTPPTPFIDPSDWITTGIDDLELRVGNSEPVGVLDDGVASGHPLLADLVLSERAFPAGHSWRPIGTHGTRVAGLAAYGDFEQPLLDGSPLIGGPLHVARVLEPHELVPDRTVFPGLEHRLVEDAIRTLHAEESVRVFNLSIADPNPFSGPHVSLWTEVLDGLVRELGIVIVVAAGNQVMPSTSATRLSSGHHILDDYASYVLDEEARVAEPGLAASVLTVGSVARSNAPATPGGASHLGDRAVAEVGEISPFSRTGPGIRGRAIKPDLVHYGGNIVISDVGMVQQNNPGVGVVSTQLAADGRLFATSVGTSFAAPRVARLAADLWARYPDASANLIRCLVGLSASRPSGATAQFSNNKDRLRAFGFGVPNFDAAAESGPNRAVIYHEGSIPIDTVDVIPVPIPESFTRGRFTRRFRVAVGFDPPVRRQRREYTAGSLKAVLLRNVELEEIERVYGRQPTAREERADLIQGRRRIDLKPGVQTFTGSTLQVREFERRSLDIDDGDIYYLLIIHQSEPWADSLLEPYESQDYAVALMLEVEGEVALDLRTLLEQRLRQRVELRLRAR